MIASKSQLLLTLDLLCRRSKEVWQRCLKYQHDHKLSSIDFVDELPIELQEELDEINKSTEVFHKMRNKISQM